MNIKTANISEGEKFCQYENLANLYVQQSAPCNYSKKANVGFLNKTKLNQEKMLYPEQEVEKGIENLEIKNEEIFKPQKFDENENLQD
jgi:hypothetical protein